MGRLLKVIEIFNNFVSEPLKSNSMKKFYLLTSLLIGFYSFSQVGTLCTDPIVISTLPYTTTDNTANYADNYDPQTGTSPACVSTTFGNFYHGGNDVIYSWTAPSDGSIKIEIPNAVAWTGMFVYTDCANIGVNYAACATSPTAKTLTIDNFAVISGQKYYIYISSWPSPQTVPYTLKVTAINLATENSVKVNGSAIYPNPAGKELNFRTENPVHSATIYDMSGKVLHKMNVSDGKISVEDLKPGSYIIEYTDRAGVTATKKFIKS